MKINSLLIIMISYFFAITLTSCESHEQTADDAFERVKEVRAESALTEKKIITDTVKPAIREIVAQPKKTVAIKKIEKNDEWCRFKIDTEKRIAENEFKIKEIKSSPYVNAKLLKRVTRLEKDNYDLRNEINKCEMEMKILMENFKTKMSKEANDIDMELNDIISNKKN